MIPKTITLRARGDKLCPHLASERGGRFVGRTADNSVGHADQCAWPAMPEGETIYLDDGAAGLMHFKRYKTEVLAECLWAGDEATAKAMGVKFDPKFGGEYAEPKSTAKTSQQPPAQAAEGKA